MDSWRGATKLWITYVLIILFATLFGLSIERPILDHHPKAHVHEIRRISYGFHEIWRISYGFHPEIRRISYGFHEICQISYGFHEIRRISYGFHPEIWRISWNLWNPADFTQISPVKSKNYKSKCFSKNSSVWWMQGGGYDQGFHEIHQISAWNLVDLTCEIWWI